MISIDLARKLKKVGLRWDPTKYDFFFIPDRGLDDSLFVLSDMAIFVEKRLGRLSVTFHGTPEWALDDILLTEVVWLPTETQLREMLELRLVAETSPTVKLMSVRDGYVCQIQFQAQTLAFEAFGASDAYGLALLHVLQNKR